MKVRPNVEVSFEVALTLTEPEARALEALAGYGTEPFLQVFYEHLGKHYLAPHEHGLRMLFASVNNKVVGALVSVDRARKLITKGDADA